MLEDPTTASQMPEQIPIASRLKVWGPLLIVVAVALALRLIFFTGMVRGDALNYAHTAYALSRGVFDANAWAGMSRLGMYVPLAILYRLFGPSEFLTLLLPIAASIASVVFVYLMARMFAGEEAGLIAALFWAFLPLDIHLSTSLLPDVPMAAGCTGSVYFLFRAEAEKRPRFYFASLFLVIAAILVKPLAIVTALSIVVFLLVRRWPAIRDRWMSRQVSPVARGRQAFLAATIVLVAIFAYLQMQSAPFVVTLSRANNDLGSFLFTGKAELDFGDIDFSRSNLMIFVAPLFLVSVLVLFKQRAEELAPVFVWAAVLYLYYEWGTINLNARSYTPLQPFSEARYFLFVLAPFVVLVGIHLARGLSRQMARRLVPLLAVVALGVGVLQKHALYSGEWTGWTALGAILLVTGSVASPAFIAHKNSGRRHAFTTLLLLSLCLLLLQPFLPYHALMFQTNLDQLNAMRASLPFWEENRDYAICTSDPMSLNYASQFQLGFDWRSLNLTDSGARIVALLDSTEESCYVLMPVGQSNVPVDWWLMDNYSMGGQSLYIYRKLDESDRGREIAVSRQALRAERSLANLERLYGANVNAANWEEVLPIWIELYHLDPAKYSLEQLSRMVAAYLERDSSQIGENLLQNSDFSLGLDGWSFHDTGEVIFREDGTAVFQMDIGSAGPSLEVVLEPGQIYLFTMRIATEKDLLIDVLRVGGGEIQDSAPHLVDPNNPTEVWAVFATPDWGEALKTQIELFVPIGEGRVRLQSPGLFAIAMAN